MGLQSICRCSWNKYTNYFSMNIYVDASRNIIIDSNILRVNTDTYNTKLEQEWVYISSPWEMEVPMIK